MHSWSVRVSPHPTRHGFAVKVCDQDGALRDEAFFPSKSQAQAFASDARQMLRARGMARENPLSDGAMVGLAVVGTALAAGIGYLIWNRSSSKTSSTPFQSLDFTANTNMTTPPSYTVGQVAQLQRLTGVFLSGTVQAVANGVYTITLTSGDGGSYASGMTLTNVPLFYLF